MWWIVIQRGFYDSFKILICLSVLPFYIPKTCGNRMLINFDNIMCKFFQTGFTCSLSLGSNVFLVVPPLHYYDLDYFYHGCRRLGWYYLFLRSIQPCVIVNNFLTRDFLCIQCVNVGLCIFELCAIHCPICC